MEDEVRCRGELTAGGCKDEGVLGLVRECWLTKPKDVLQSSCCSRKVNQSCMNVSRTNHMHIAANPQSANLPFTVF